MYTHEEIEKALGKDFVDSRIECEAMELNKLRELLESGWVLYDIRATEEDDVKILTLAR